MSKYTFTCEYVDMTGQPDGSKITLEVQEESLTNVVEAFERFLKGAGFVFDGYLDIVDDADSRDEYKESMHWPFLPEETTFGSHYSESKDTPELYDSQDVMQAPGTIGGATVVLSGEKCKRCGLTKKQLGSNTCYDDDCGLQ